MTDLNSAILDGFDFDAELQLKDAGAVSSSGAATVGGDAKILDLGEAKMTGSVVANVAAMDSGTGDESATILVQYSKTADFSADNITLQALPIGDDGVTQAGDNFATGLYVIPVRNVGPEGSVYRFMRLFTLVGGTSPSINYTAHLALQTKN